MNINNHPRTDYSGDLSSCSSDPGQSASDSVSSDCVAIQPRPPPTDHLSDQSNPSLPVSGSSRSKMKSSKLFFSFRMFKRPRQKGFVSTLLCCFRPNVTPPVEEQPPKCNNNNNNKLLPQVDPFDKDKICLVIDLDETLVHSSFKPISNPDFIVPVEIDGAILSVYVLKRPFVDEFLQEVGKLYECVLFTASLPKYAGPVADLLDQWGVFRARLYRESCVFYNGSYIKDLSRLGRDLKRVVIVDNSPASYFFHKNNAVPVSSWFDDKSDFELRDLIPFFEKLSRVDDVYSILKTTTDPQPNPPTDDELNAQNAKAKGIDTSPITQVMKPANAAPTNSLFNNY